MLTVKCSLTVIDVNGSDAEKDDPRRVVVKSYETKGCGEGEYVTLILPDGSSATVRADDLKLAVENAANTVPSDESRF